MTCVLFVDTNKSIGGFFFLPVQHLDKISVMGNNLCLLLKSSKIDVRGWSENFSASTIDGNTIGKIFFSKLVQSVISIHLKLQVILSSSLFYTAV